MPDIRLVVVDAAPLITLAAAKSLDYLLFPGLPVIIPDAVFHEATASAGKLGAMEIVDWYRSNTASVRIEYTDTFQAEVLLRAQPGYRPARDIGERAAIELIRYTPLLTSSGDRAMLLSDDRDVGRIVVVDTERLVLMTTWGYLRQLEEAGRIQSADEVIASAREAGRHPAIRDLWSQHDPDIQEAVKAILARKPVNEA